MTREPTYSSGQPIQEGDIVQLGSWDAVVEIIFTSESPGWEEYWHEHGEGVMLAGPAFGRVHTKFHDPDLIFVGRNRNET